MRQIEDMSPSEVRLASRLVKLIKAAKNDLAASKLAIQRLHDDAWDTQMRIDRMQMKLNDLRQERGSNERKEDS